MTSEQHKSHGLGLRWMFVAMCVAASAAYMTYRLGAKAGITVTYMTWCFLVLATPMADGGGWLNIPVRLLTGIPMVTIELVVIAVTLVSCALAVRYSPNVFQHTAVLRAFHVMLTTPFPYWGIIVVCLIGTMLSVRIGDIVMDRAEDAIRNKSMALFFRGWPAEIVFASVLLAIIWWYYIIEIVPLFSSVMKTRSVYKVLFI
jgi:hypothetical protein